MWCLGLYETSRTDFNPWYELQAGFPIVVVQPRTIDTSILQQAGHAILQPALALCRHVRPSQMT